LDFDFNELSLIYITFRGKMRDLEWLKNDSESPLPKEAVDLFIAQYRAVTDKIEKIAPDIKKLLS